MLEKRSNSRTVFGHNPPGHEVKMVEIHHPLTAVPSAALCIASRGNFSDSLLHSRAAI